jgi:hypothetical protein
MDSPHPSPQQMEHDIPHNRQPQQPQQQNQRPLPESSTNPRAPRQEHSDNLKSFKVTLDDPTWKVLPAALKKYKINNENWQDYAMFICYGSTGTLIYLSD